MGNHPGDPEESRDEVGTARVHAHAMDNPERPPSAQVTAKQNSQQSLRPHKENKRIKRIPKINTLRPQLEGVL